MEDKDLEKNAESYAQGYAEVGYDDDQIASVRDAFIDGAKWQKDRVWHTKNDNPPQEGKKIICLWGQGDNIKDLNQSMGVLITAFRDRNKIVRMDCGSKTFLFESVKLWAYIEDLLPKSLVAF